VQALPQVHDVMIEGVDQLQTASPHCLQKACWEILAGLKT
jgi:hypothetical protein